MESGEQKGSLASTGGIHQSSNLESHLCLSLALWTERRGVSAYWRSKARLIIDWRAGFDAECLLAVLLVWGGVCDWGDEVAAEGEVKVDAVLQPLVSEGDHCVAGVDGSALGFEDLDDGYEAF